ncbi:hypothetical protein AB0N17_22535 [Streptomyces sp. NPDC051133]|uniref:hypothetical protein n=1 Tax=Streptomyces sp. NPDC051133 TaxID=3155521 RepID=UPI003414B4F0
MLLGVAMNFLVSGLTSFLMWCTAAADRWQRCTVSSGTSVTHNQVSSPPSTELPDALGSLSVSGSPSTTSRTACPLRHQDGLLAVLPLAIGGSTAPALVEPAAGEALERVADQFSASLGVWVWRQRRKRPLVRKNR